MNAEISANFDKIHTTELGIERIRKNLGLADTDIVAWCKEKIKNSNNIVRRGKNWYIHIDNAIITLNASSFTVITAHKV